MRQLKKILALLLTTGMIAGSLAACGSKESTETQPAAETTAEETEQADEATAEVDNDGYLVWNLGSEPKTLDPNLYNDAPTRMIITQMYESLTYPTADGVEPGVAESWEMSDDCMTYTFHLRKDAKWSDGSPLTANDFYYTWMRICNPENAVPMSTTMVDYVAGAAEYFNGTGSAEDVQIKVVDDYTLEVGLKSPMPFFAEQVSLHNYSPVKQEAVESGGDSWATNPETQISNGPFKFVEYQVGSHILLEKNENYWNADAVKIKGIKIVFVNDSNTSLQAYQSGEIDTTDVIPPEQLPTLIAEDSNLQITESPSTTYFYFNVDVEPLTDVKVRRALTLAIDRSAITEQITKAGEIPATGYLPSCLQNTQGESVRKLDADGNPTPEYGIDPYSASVEEAQKLLAEAGYENGEGFPTIDILYATGDLNKLVVEAVQQMWKDNLNIDVTVRNLDFADFMTEKGNGNFMVARNATTGSYYDASSMMKQFLSTGGSNTGWRWQYYEGTPYDTNLNPEQKEFDELYDKAMNATGTERDELWAQVEDVLMENAPICPLYYSMNTRLINGDKVQGVITSKDSRWVFKRAEFVTK